MEERQPPTEDSSPRFSLRSTLVPAVIILAVAVAGLLALRQNLKKEPNSATALLDLAEGVTVPDLKLERLDGSSVQLSEIPAKVLLVNFWATWCEACIVEMPSIVKLREKFQPQGLEVLAVNLDENPARAVPPIVEKFGMKFPVFMDPKGALSEVFDVHAIPLTVIIGEDRKILMVESGERDWESAEVYQMMEKWVGSSD